MKKILLFLVLLFMPISIKAYGINEYKIDMDVLENGDIKVVEEFFLTGDYNGYERIINYTNPNTIIFDGTLSSFYGSTIYNATDVIIEKVGAKSNFNGELKEFTLATYAEAGDRDKYTITDESDGYSIRIFNPTSSGKYIFYVEYLIKDAVVNHNDVSEVAWNVFSTLQNESIGKMTIDVSIKNNKDELRVWAAGPLHGFSKIVDKQNLYFEIEDLRENTPLSIRFVYDQNLSVNAKKKSNMEALSLILQVENKKADDANKIREEIREREEFRKNVGQILDVTLLVWLAGLGFVIVRTFLKHDREYEGSFKTKYFRDFPSDVIPSTVGYLLDKKINSKEMSATIMDLVQRKIITYEEVSKKVFVFRKNYTVSANRLIINSNFKDITIHESEAELLDFIFNVIAEGDLFTVEDINRFAKSNYKKFLDGYNRYINMATREAVKMNYFEDKGLIKFLSVLYVLFGAGLSLYMIITSFTNSILIHVAVFFAAFIAIFYLISFLKRTKVGNEEYLKWNGLKNFINDFGNFEERDLPQVHLWEKYLVYAVVFGNAKKLVKAMEIKFKEMPETDPMFNIYYFNTLNNINRNISSGVTRAVSTAQQIQYSQNSSGSGGGGGFTGGGGSFGGGGGGGRF